MKRLVLSLLISSFMLPAFAQVPKTLSFQGYLIDQITGDPLTAGLDMTFSLWDAASSGTQLWFENHSAVPVSKGLYNVLLGDAGTPINLPFDKVYYLQVKVGLEILGPRITVSSAAYSLSSINASTITTGTISNALLDPELQDLADGSLSGSLVGTGINAANITTNSMAVANGGTGVNTLTGALIGNGTSPVVGLASTGANQYFRRNAANSAYEFAGLSITGSEIANTTITAADLANSSVTGGSGGIIADGTITSADLASGSVAGGPGGIIADASITSADLATGSVNGGTNGVITDNSITSADIADGTITNADIVSSAGIAGSKISPDFGAQNIVTTGSLTAGAAGQVSVTTTGYTKLGNSGVSVSASVPAGAAVSFPSIRLVKITGTMAAADLAATVTLSGLTDSKIISIQVLVDYQSGSDYIQSGFTASPGLHFQYNFQDGILYIRNITGSSANLAGRPYKAIIIYEE